jgi:F-type H+-transporting ATPase subunit a
MVVTWIVALGLILFARVATRKMQFVPAGAQNFLEWLVESLYEFLEGIIGSELVKRTFWFFATVFIFILATNWFGLIPGVGTIGWGKPGPARFRGHPAAAPGRQRRPEHDVRHGHDLLRLLDRLGHPGRGIKGVFLDLFGPKGDTTGLLRVLMIVVFFLVGFPGGALHPVPAHLAQLPSLWQYICRGEHAGSDGSTGPWLGWLLPVPFYFMELLVGIVQALVFMLLTAVFTMLICMHEEEPGGAAH